MITLFKSPRCRKIDYEQTIIMNLETALQRSSGNYLCFAFYSFQYVFDEIHAKMNIEKKNSTEKSINAMPGK